MTIIHQDLFQIIGLLFVFECCDFCLWLLLYISYTFLCVYLLNSFTDLKKKGSGLGHDTNQGVASLSSENIGWQNQQLRPVFE